MFRDVPECSMFRILSTPFNNDDLPFMPMVVTVLHDSPKHFFTTVRQFVHLFILIFSLNLTPFLNENNLLIVSHVDLFLAALFAKKLPDLM